MGLMTIAVLPFNAGPNTKPALARQIANFACDVVRNQTGAEVNAVNYLIRLDDGPQPRFANVNASEALNEWEMINQMFDQSQADKAMEGLLVETDGKYAMTVRFFDRGNETPTWDKQYDFSPSGIFAPLKEMLQELSRQSGTELPMDDKQVEELFGTENGEAFLKFLESYDALQYIEKTQGQVALEFDPTSAMDTLVESAKLDLDWEAPYVTLVQLCRSCSNHRIGDPAEIEKRLKMVIETAPDDARGYFALGELYQAMGNLQDASTNFEKASSLEPEEAAIITRLGMVQSQMGMPVNAERNFRKAVEMEGDDKPSMDFLAQVLFETNRGHEVPALWKGLIEKTPQNPAFHAKLALAYANLQNDPEAEAAFEKGLECEDNTLIKRYYAPFLANHEHLDRAMDFYEDCLDAAPNDIQVLIEYAQTLQKAGREFEIPKVLKTVLESSPDQNTAAQTHAWLTELEQPKRVETVASAQKLIETEDFEGALRLLKPMRNWLADYWKMWVLLAVAHNRLEQFEESEEAATRAINIFPGCEPAYNELASSFGGQGKNEEAYNMLRFAAGNVPNSLPIFVNLALASKRVDKNEEAKEIARQIREGVGPNMDKSLEEILTEIERD